MLVKAEETDAVECGWIILCKKEKRDTVSVERSDIWGDDQVSAQGR